MGSKALRENYRENQATPSDHVIYMSYKDAEMPMEELPG